jgi:AbrB family looped-hinge helix DNA binding protein
MARSAKTTTVSTKGQVILPKAIRDELKWDEGTQLTVERTGDGVLLKEASVFAPTKPGAAFGMLMYKGRAKTLKEMDAAISAEVRRRHARGRY